MRPIERNSEAALKFIADWVDLLSKRRFDEAVSLLRVRPIPIRGSDFHRFLCRLGLREPHSPFLLTGDFVRDQISTYKEGAVVTSPLKASGSPSRARLVNSLDVDDVEGTVHSDYPFAVFWSTDPQIDDSDYLGSAIVDLPINGAWSDYTTEFSMHSENGNVVFELGQMGVL